MRTFLILAFWYWFYNQLFFLLAAMGFFIIHFLYNVPIVMDSLVGSIESDMGIKAT